MDSSILSGYKAHETEFEMILYDWWDHQDDTKLYCLYYYRETTSRRWEKIFTHEEPYEPMMARTFTLREGK